MFFVLANYSLPLLTNIGDAQYLAAIEDRSM
jgi:hypothetical protein